MITCGINPDLLFTGSDLAKDGMHPSGTDIASAHTYIRWKWGASLAFAGHVKIPSSVDVRKVATGSIKREHEALRVILTETGEIKVRKDVSTSVVDVTKAIRPSVIE